MDKAASLLPSTIEQATKGTPVAMLMQVVDRKNIEAFLAIELTKLASLINVDERLNLQGHQIPFICAQLVDLYKSETLADFKICFERGAMGRYDDKLLRLDAAVINNWMGKYLEEKYQVIENQLMSEKESPYQRMGAAKIDWVTVNPERNFLALYKAVVGEVKPEENPNDYFKIKMEHARKKGEFQKLINRVSSDFYKDRDGQKEIKQWDDEEKGFYVLAETLEDAEKIYLEAEIQFSNESKSRR